MNQAFYTGITGLQSQQSGIDVTSNNIANIDTYGYKGNSVEFKTLFDKAMATTSSRSPVNSTTGVGATLQATPTIQKTGSIIVTEKNTDLAIGGNGWFGVRGRGTTMYTRSGNFSFDTNRSLVNADGQYVLGTLASRFDSNNVLTSKEPITKLGSASEQTSIKLPQTLHYPPTATTIASFKGNIGRDDKIQKMGATLIDKDGNKNALTLIFKKTVPQPKLGVSWDLTATTNSIGTVENPTKVYDKKTGVITFNEYGSLIGSTINEIDNNGAKVKLDFGKGYTGVVSNSSDSSASSSSDGLNSGELVGYDINRDGEVVATFTNGQQVSMAKIAVFHFQNDQGLINVGGANYIESANSGEPMFYKDADGNPMLGATVMNSKLESSNTDPAAGLTDLIIYQRAYDANAKLLTTSDQMIQKALQMHR
ncbi:flagellar hook-basal body complex protein [bacterium]|nr:flagellar hook-basal body complex protein [bacterium]MBU1884560.1 flagellar hook-basal body complex protein [bacterium]